jgi:hypothetical protein
VEQGSSVAVSGDGNTAVVGGPYDNGGRGAAWVFSRIGGVWIQQGAKLVGAGADGLARQGDVAVSADGNTAVVGGPGDNGEAGAAWVFIRIGGVWVQEGDKLVGTGAVVPASQGISVALSADGNTAVVGGPDENNQAGAAWVFVRIAGVWIQQGDKLVGTGAAGAASQGASVAVSADGNTALVGGLGDNDQAGAAWVYTRSGGVWSQQGAKLVGTGAIGAALQGISVALSGDGNTAVVGGYADNAQVGAAWVYTRSGGVWSQQGAKLVGTGAVTSTQQGCSVAVSADGNTAVVGGRGDNAGTGATWVYTRSGGVWSQQGDKLVGTGAVGPAEQGNSVAVSGDGSTVVVGGATDDNYLGAAWVFANTEPTTLVASFFCDRIGDVPIPAQFLNTSATGPAKVCADGADAGYVALQRVSGSFDLSHVRFRIKEGASPEVYGQFTDPGPAVTSGISYRYVHPSTPPPDCSQNLPITFQAYDSQSGQPVFECPMAVFRAPVVMVHGIWANSSSFDAMGDYFQYGGPPTPCRRYPAPLVYAVNYEWTADRDFHTNCDVVPNAILQELALSRSAGFSAARVDIVAHSMGGILTRLYLQDSFSDAAQPYRRDINRFITLNTPYWGSQCANLILDPNVRNHGGLTLAALLTLFGRDPTAGAVSDLRVDSNPIVNALNGATFTNRGVVPTHVVVTHGDFGDQALWDDHFKALYRLVAWHLCMYKETLASLVFDGASNDIVVSAESQRGGIPTFDTVSGQLHTGSPGDPDVIYDVRDALQASPSNATVWSRAGFKFTQLPYHSPRTIARSRSTHREHARPRPLSPSANH